MHGAAGRADPARGQRRESLMVLAKTSGIRSRHRIMLRTQTGVRTIRRASVGVLGHPTVGS